MTSRLHKSLPLLALLGLLAAGSVASAQEPLHLRIDQLIEANQVGPVAPLAGDAEFLRRACLDLTGTIPSSVEARAFVDDPAPNKRQLLIDRLLASPRFTIHMATVFDVMLMERRPEGWKILHDHSSSD